MTAILIGGVCGNGFHREPRTLADAIASMERLHQMFGSWSSFSIRLEVI